MKGQRHEKIARFAQIQSLSVRRGTGRSHMKRLVICVQLAALGTVAILAAHPVEAQTTSQAQSSGQPAADQLEEVLVTAQRRSERLEKVPISVTVVNRETLRDLNITSLPALQLVTPSMSYSTGNGFAMVYIRGVGANFANPGVENPVAVYADGAYVPRSLGGNLDVFDVSSVQVLKGPQGTLWGRNATGGAILITTADPTFETTARASAVANESCSGSASRFRPASSVVKTSTNDPRRAATTARLPESWSM